MATKETTVLDSKAEKKQIKDERKRLKEEEKKQKENNDWIGCLGPKVLSKSSSAVLSPSSASSPHGIRTRLS